MMYQNTGLKILKRYGHTTERVEKNQSASRRLRKLHAHGGKRMVGEIVLMEPWQEPYVMGGWYASRASDAGLKNPSLITKTMTNLWKLCGFANRATYNTTKINPF